jgi:lipopolysaccharide transport system permease protein
MNRDKRHYLDLILVLIQKQMKVRYKNSFLGYLWSIGHPLAFAIVFFVAFRLVMRIEIENYALFLICGLFSWQWFANSINSAPVVFLENASVIKKVNFPRNLLPFAHVMQDMIHFVLAIPVVVVFLIMHGSMPSPTWIFGVPVLLAVQFLLIYGICLAVSAVNLFFRDLERLTAIIMMLFFYATPVIYQESMVPEKLLPLLYLNPFTPLVICWRKLLLHGAFDVTWAGLGLVYALLSLHGGRFVYRRLAPRFAEVL